MDHKAQDDRVATDRTTDRSTTECARCGLLQESLSLTWTCSVENGKRLYFCDACGRDNLRSIEGRVDSGAW